MLEVRPQGRRRISESQLVALVAAMRAGHSNTEAARIAGVSVATANTYRYRLHEFPETPAAPVPVTTAASARSARTSTAPRGTTTATTTDQTGPSHPEYRIRRELYAYLAGDGPMPRCPCGSPTFIGGEVAVRPQVCRYISRNGRRCDAVLRSGDDLCRTHLIRARAGTGTTMRGPVVYADAEDGDVDNHGHCLRCARSRVPPWCCQLGPG